jgi:hypothetical protein
MLSIFGLGQNPLKGPEELFSVQPKQSQMVFFTKRPALKFNFDKFLQIKFQIPTIFYHLATGFAP